MTISWHTGVLIALFAGLSAPASATPERIGAWVLDCAADRPAADGCQLRFAQRFVDNGGITGDLEVEAQGKRLVPVLALRGLSAELLLAAAMAGKVMASIQFPGISQQALDCAASNGGYFCAPRDSAAQLLAARLPTAQSITISVSVTITGINPLPVQQRSLQLSGTSDALARLRSAGARAATPAPPRPGRPAPQNHAPEALAPETPVPASPGPAPQVPGSQEAAPLSHAPAGLVAMADKALKSAGYQNGIAGLRDMLAGYLRK